MQNLLVLNILFNQTCYNFCWSWEPASIDFWWPSKFAGQGLENQYYFEDCLAETGQICRCCLTHCGPVTHICVGKLTIIGSDNGLSPERRQAIIWTNARILLIGPLGTNFSEILIEILTFSFTKMSLKVSSAKWRPFCLGLNVLTHCGPVMPDGDMEQGQHWLE